MWRCGDPPSMRQMCDSSGHDMLVGLSNIELGNLLKRHGYTITRAFCTLRYLEAKAEKMFKAGKQMCTSLSAAQRINTLNANRRILEEARRHTIEEVQGLRASLEKAQKELEEQR